MNLKRIAQFVCLFLLVPGFYQKLLSQNTFLKEYVTNSIDDNFGVHCSTPDGGFLLAGTESSTQPSRRESIVFLKLDKRGKLMERVALPNSNGEECYDLLACRDGGFLCCGYNMVVKINADLKEQWRVKISNSWSGSGASYNAIELADSGFLFSRYVGSSSGGYNQIKRLTKLGKRVWSKGFKIYDQDPNSFWSANYGYEMELDADSNVNIIGTLFSSRGSYICLLRIDLNGNRLYSRQFFNPKYTKGTFFETDGPNRLVIAGTYPTPNAINVHHLYLVESDTLGDTIKTRQFSNIPIHGRADGGFKKVGNRFVHCAIEPYGNYNFRLCLSVFNNNLDSLYTRRFEFGGRRVRSLDFSLADDSFLVASGNVENAKRSYSNNFFLLKTKIDGAVEPCGLLQYDLNSTGPVFTQCERDSTLLTLYSNNSTPSKIEWFRNGKRIKSGKDSMLYVKDTAEYFTVIQAGNCIDTTSSVKGWSAKSYQDTLEASICKGDDYWFGGFAKWNPGVYYDSSITVNGCDSVAVLKLEVIQPTYQTFYEKLCPRDTIWFAGVAHTKRGYYQYTLKSSRGCDSNVNIGISPAKTYDTTLIEYICRGSFYQLGTRKLRQKGYYEGRLKSVYGCDSVVKLYLRFKDTDVVHTKATLCSNETLSFGSQIISDAGQYVDTFLNKKGCDSVVFLTVREEHLNIKLRPTGDTLIAAVGYAEYSWFNCTDQVLLNETSNRLVVKDDKFYQVAVQSKQGCSDTSWCTSRNIAVGKSSFENKVNLFPNPFDSKVLLSSKMKNITGVDVYDVTGRNVLKMSYPIPSNNISINTSSWNTGIYFFHVQMLTGSSSYMLTKTQ